MLERLNLQRSDVPTESPITVAQSLPITVSPEKYDTSIGIVTGSAIEESGFDCKHRRVRPYSPQRLDVL
jgi:hypothetical protein